jgi:hypothetical protein
VNGYSSFFFLYPASKLGFTSPVGGPFGRFAVDDAGNVPITGPQDHFLSFNRVQSQFAGRNRVSSREYAHAILNASVNEHEPVR